MSRKYRRLLSFWLAVVMLLTTVSPLVQAEEELQYEIEAAEETDETQNEESETDVEYPEESELFLEEEQDFEQTDDEQILGEEMAESEMPETDIEDVPAVQEAVGRLEYKFANGVLTIWGNGAMPEYISLDDDGDVEEDLFPWAAYRGDITDVIVLDGVTSISTNAFWNCSSLETVTFGKDLKTIGENAFYWDESLQTIIWGEESSVRTIEESAFDNCTALDNVVLPDSVSIIGNYAFDGCEALTKVRFGRNVKVIGEGAFSNCDSIQSLILPRSLNIIGANAFDTCESLQKIHFLGNAPKIGEDAFLYVCTANEIEEGTIFTCYYPAGNITWNDIVENNKSFGATEGGIQIQWLEEDPVWTLEDGVLTILGWTMNGREFKSREDAPWYEERDEITSIIVEDGAEKIGEYAFAGCKNVKTVHISRIVKSVGNHAFAGCSSLTEIYYDAYLLRWKNICKSKTLDIPNGVEMKYNDQACGDSSDWIWEEEERTVVISGSGKLWNFTEKNAVDCSNDFCDISPWTYLVEQEKMAQPEVIRMESGITEPGTYLCSEDNALKQVIIPDTVKTWNPAYFYDCKELEEFVVAGENEYFAAQDGILYNKEETQLVQYPKGKQEPDYDMPVTLKSVQKDAVEGSAYLRKISFPRNMEEISTGAFPNCPELRILMIFDKITEIKAMAFPDSYNFEKICYSGTKSKWEKINISDIGNGNLKNAVVEYRIFDPMIYQADYINSHKIGTQINSTLSAASPSEILLKSARDNNLISGVDAWNEYVKSIGVLLDGGKLTSYGEFKKDDVYLGILLALYEENYNKLEVLSVLDRSEVSTITKVSSTLADIMKKVYQIDLYSMTESDWKSGDITKETIFKQAGKLFENSGLGQVTGYVKKVDSFKNKVNSMEELVNLLQNALVLQKLSESEKIICRELKAEAEKNGNQALQRATIQFAALIDDTEGMSAFEKYILEKYVFEKGISNTLSKKWAAGKTYLYKSYPYAALTEIAYKGSTTICDLVLGSSSIAEKYVKLEAVQEISDMLDKIYDNRSEKYRDNKSSETAQAYLTALDLRLRCLDQECAAAESFAKSVDSAWLNKFLKAFGASNTTAMIKSIKSIRNSYKNLRIDARTMWVGELQADPDYSDFYDDYSYLQNVQYQESVDAAQAKAVYSVACPVDVQILDSMGNQVAYTNGEDAVSSENGSVEVQVFGQQKFIFFYDTSRYTVRYVGTGEGNMKIHILKYENGSAMQSVVYPEVSISTGKVYTSIERNGLMEPGDYLNDYENNTVTPEITDLSTIKEAAPDPEPEPVPAPNPEPEHSHTYGSWSVVREATALVEGEEVQYCSVCGDRKQRSISRLTPTISVNAASIPLKVKQSTSAVKVSGLAAGDYIVSWRSSNSKIASVTSSGKITAKNKTGKAVVTVRLASGLEKNITVKVQKKSVTTTSIRNVKKNVTLQTGKSTVLQPVINPVTSTQKVTYKSSNKKVAVVNSKGKITAKKKGKAVITVKSGKKTVKCKVTVR